MPPSPLILSTRPSDAPQDPSIAVLSHEVCKRYVQVWLGYLIDLEKEGRKVAAHRVTLETILKDLHNERYETLFQVFSKIMPLRVKVLAAYERDDRWPVGVASGLFKKPSDFDPNLDCGYLQVMLGKVYAFILQQDKDSRWLIGSPDSAKAAVEIEEVLVDGKPHESVQELYDCLFNPWSDFARHCMASNLAIECYNDGAMADQDKQELRAMMEHRKSERTRAHKNWGIKWNTRL